MANPLNELFDFTSDVMHIIKKEYDISQRKRKRRKRLGKIVKKMNPAKLFIRKRPYQRFKALI